MQQSIILTLTFYAISFVLLYKYNILKWLTVKEYSADDWIKYDFTNLEKRPKESGRYFVHRKDGKVHWEVWNGNGFAYNDNSITHFRKINPPNC